MRERLAIAIAAVSTCGIEFLNLRSVSCSGLSLQGTGSVLVTPSPACGKSPVTVDLGPSFSIDEPAGASALPAYGTTVTVSLQ
jgi:hypothetical protein